MSAFLRLLPGLPLVALAAVTIAASCSAAPDDGDGGELVGAPEDVETRNEGVSGDLAEGTVLRSTANVNLRSGPSTDYKVLGVVAEGSQVTVVTSTPANGFYKVKHDGIVGWSYGKYFEKVTAEGLDSDLAVGTVLRATTDVNLRGGPSTDTNVLDVVSEGSTVKVLAESPKNGFYNVSHDGMAGWSSGKYYEIAGNPPGGGGQDDGQDGSGGSGGSPGSPTDKAIGRAKASTGFSYWWGHGRFRPEGPTSQTKGQCSGGCPSCSHSGSYGGDCSGLVGKVWQVPASNSDLTVDSHPYGTIHFNKDSNLWKTVKRGNVQKADALVYNSGGAGHIFVYDKGDGWGTMYAYECKGCSYGCVAGYRTAGSAYHAIRRAGW